jgi:hypothetical protein
MSMTKTGYVLRQKGFDNGRLFSTLPAAIDYRSAICKMLGDKPDNYEILVLGDKVNDQGLPIERLRSVPKTNKEFP